MEVIPVEEEKKKKRRRGRGGGNKMVMQKVVVVQNKTKQCSNRSWSRFSTFIFQVSEVY